MAELGVGRLFLPAERRTWRQAEHRSAFVIHDHHVLTAWHCISSIGGENAALFLRLHPRDGESEPVDVQVVYREHSVEFDAAVLVVEDGPWNDAEVLAHLDAVALPLGTDVAVHDQVRIIGHSVRNPERYATAMSAAVTSPDAPIGLRPAVQLQVPALAAAYEDTPKGMSGGPLLRPYPDGTERVVGVVSKFPAAGEDRSAARGGAVLCRRIVDLRDIFPAVRAALRHDEKRASPAVAAPAAALVSLDAYRLDARWDPAAQPGPPPLHEAYRARIDVRLCLPPTPGTHIVAGPADPGLATGLDAVEQRIRSAGAARRWHRASVDALVDRASGDGPHGYVIDWRPEYPNARAVEVRAHLLDADPVAAIVFSVTAARVVDALATGARLARSLGLDEVLARRAEPAPFAAGPVDVAVALPHGAVRAALASRLDLAQHGYAGTVPATQAPPLPTDADPVEVAATVVAESAGTNTDRDLAALRAELVAVREFMPAFYYPLLAAHARARGRPVWVLSMSVAAAFDEDLDEWLRAAGTVPLPGVDVSPRQLSAGLAEAMTLALLRACAAPAPVRAWAAYAATDVRAMVEAWAATPGGLDESFLATAPAARAVLAERARLLEHLDPVAVPGAFQMPACWALIARRPVTARTDTWVATLPSEALRRLVSDGPGALADPRLRGELDDLCQAWRPALPIEQTGGP